MSSAPAEEQVPGPSATRALPGGIETVLVVEDDPLVRGYVVIECADGKTDLMALRRGEEVDLLFSDIFLSDNMDGITLAQEARRLRPHLKVLLTSGNASGSAGAASRLAGHHVLAKPYGRGELAATLRAVLERPI